ncbi:MAG: glycosyltransferase [candidate division SR1 bacterium]|nr:glycosyltransferase [candidate division SR1 bacterium]
MLKQKINIITVGYNEEKNLPKLYNSLKNLDHHFEVRKIYIDQSSTDTSVDIAKKYGCETYVHPNKGYADPDKKRAVEELCQDNDWCCILDADEEISPELAKELATTIQANTYDILKISIVSIFLGGYGGEAYQERVFKKSAMKVTDEIHHYLQPISKNIGKTKNKIRNDDRKYEGNEIDILMSKFNRYSEIEVTKIGRISKAKILWNFFYKPLLHFFGRGIIHKQFLRGIPGIIVCTMHGYYQFLIYAKLYEKLYIIK